MPHRLFDLQRQQVTPMYVQTRDLISIAAITLTLLFITGLEVLY